MGLDIYLYRYDNFEETRKKEEKYQEFSEKTWEGKEYDKMTQEEKDELYKQEEKFAESLGLDNYGMDKKDAERCEFPSEKYPEHYFKIGYFRSSYNGGGINHILGNLGLPRLAEIFGVDPDEYYVHPNWATARANLQKLLEDLKAKPNYRAHKIDAQSLSSSGGPLNEKEAIDIFLKEVERNKDSAFSDGYSNINGDFYIKTPLKVLGMIPGQSPYGTRPCLYVVTEGENEWYEQAIEIMIETCDYVLAQPNINQYYLHWSG